MNAGSYCLFETAVGGCGIAWREAGDRWAVAHLVLPEATVELTEQLLARRLGSQKADATPATIAAVIEKVQKHLSGELQDFQEVLLDLTSANDFDRAVYAAAMRIPPGETRTYGEIAEALPASVQPPTSNLKPLVVPRSVGQALARNPIPIIIPCHRVLAANGRLGGFSAPGALQTKTKLLAIEGAKFPGVLAFPS